LGRRQSHVAKPLQSDNVVTLLRFRLIKTANEIFHRIAVVHPCALSRASVADTWSLKPPQRFVCCAISDRLSCLDNVPGGRAPLVEPNLVELVAR